MRKYFLYIVCVAFLGCMPARAAQQTGSNHINASASLVNKVNTMAFADKRADAEYHVFKWQWEPNEKSFKVLIPEDWIVEGGIRRIDPTAGGGAANAIEAKLDFIMKKDAQGTVMMHWYPDMFYFDMRHSPAGQMGLFPTGSNYNGMTVLPLPSAAEYIEIAFPYARPKATDFKIIEQKELPELARAAQKEDRLIIDMGFTYDAAIVTAEYRQNGKQYEEKFVAVIMNLGQAGAGMWKNRYTFSIRAPKGELKAYEPLFEAIGRSTTINRQWLVAEVKAQFQRAGIMDKTLKEIQRIGYIVKVTQASYRLGAKQIVNFFIRYTLDQIGGHRC